MRVNGCCPRHCSGGCGKMALAVILGTIRFILSSWTLLEPLVRQRRHTGQPFGNRKPKKRFRIGQPMM